MRIAIFGAGAVGGYFGARLVEAGRDVVFVARGEHLRAMTERGLRVESIAGDLQTPPLVASADPADLGVADAVLLAVKAWQVPEAARAMRPLVGEHTVVVPLENGVEAPDQLAAELGAEPVLAGLCGLISFIAGPGHLRHVGAEPFLRFGEVDGSVSERARRLCAEFDGCVGVRADVPDDIQAAVWRKFVLIAAMSGVGAVTRAPAGVLRADPATRALLEGAMRETLAVARARGVAIDEAAVAEAIGFVDALPAGATASMQRDVIEGRPSELDSQNGAVVRLGRAAGVATPVNEFLHAALLPQERRARGELEF